MGIVAGMVTLSAWRREQGLTARALGEKLGASKGAVMKWERGERVPRRMMMRRIHDLTGGAVSYASWAQDLEPSPALLAPVEGAKEPLRADARGIAGGQAS